MGGRNPPPTPEENVPTPLEENFHPNINILRNNKTTTTTDNISERDNKAVVPRDTDDTRSLSVSSHALKEYIATLFGDKSYLLGEDFG